MFRNSSWSHPLLPLVLTPAGLKIGSKTRAAGQTSRSARKLRSDSEIPKVNARLDLVIIKHKCGQVLRYENMTSVSVLVAELVLSCKDRSGRDGPGIRTEERTACSYILAWSGRWTSVADCVDQYKHQSLPVYHQRLSVQPCIPSSYAS